ncbi:SET and MYND domain-containing protein 4 [Anolis carolinensis]|uniref:Protein-lysine N-methyltransferase SMYD4 n=1 Tax=Anolis carolinensis TaxID=28377 RepID=H9GLB6_ANOCA|nr:PREDICTED: SET and MYND domain-containing protein 4 [Anolis carolinensis]XP_016852440.1 PREDICTED: SET and MYND domain-containing protein 4 [Anolis carolinensis]|eukprot:XP_008117659.1 PREDICTED: SET and MYND domain-containing protein 4 [Anolis carolinensis]
MDLPVEKWQMHVRQKWSSLEPSLKEKLSRPSSLRAAFLLSSSLLQPEDEEYLLSLSKDFSVNKDPSLVLSCKEDGNTRFRRKEYKSAAALYSKALSHAEIGSPEMAICYANRSAALFHLGQFEVCLADIGRAQEGGYPEKLSPKLFLRRAECLQKVSQLEGERVPETDAEAWEENGLISCASPSMRLAFSKDKGRHCIAQTDIVPGEILLKEEAFVAVLCPGEEDIHCHHCLSPLVASVPCRGCSYAKYCGSACARAAWQSYHQRECPFGGLLLAMGVFCHVALRTIFVAGFEEVTLFVENDEEQTTGISIPGCDADGRYRSSYQAVFGLLPHVEKHSPEFKFLCGFSVAALCRVMGKELFVGKDGENVAQDVLGEAVLRHVLQLQCNAQAVTALRVSGCEAVARQEEVTLATALFPVLSLLNHSCDPNTSVTFDGRTATARASRAIPRGQEILHCYGPHRCRMKPSERRQRLLAQYFFECRCSACTDETGPESASGSTLFCCPTCRAPMQGEGLFLCCSSASCKAMLPKEGFQHQLRELRQHMEAAMDLLAQGKADRSVEQLRKCHLEAQQLLSPGHLVVGEIEDHLAQVHATQGNWPEAAAHLRRSIEVVEAHYGAGSIEVGQELFKLAQVLFNGRFVPEALQAAEKAEAVLSVQLGPRGPEVQELQEMKACLEKLLQG